MTQPTPEEITQMVKTSLFRRYNGFLTDWVDIGTAVAEDILAHQRETMRVCAEALGRVVARMEAQEVVGFSVDDYVAVDQALVRLGARPREKSA
jgi:hypothetical protein